MKLKFIILLTILGFIFSLIISFILFTGPKMRNQPSVKTFESVHNLPSEDAMPMFTDEFDSTNFVLPYASDGNLQRGKIYYHYYCVFCHGFDGKGSGPVGISYVPKPSDLSGASVKAMDLIHLYRASFNGTGHAPVLSRIVSQENRRYILLYISNGFPEK